MSRPNFEKLEVYKLAEKLADEIWRIVSQWDSFNKDTIGKQIVRSADSISANIAEGEGRYNFQDNKRFIKVARGSLYETISWLRRAYKRNLLTTEQIQCLHTLIHEISPKLNAYLNSIGKTSNNY
ncbi:MULTISPECIES: four helix bundle protein [Nostocales]|uniref:Four helix bundle protein n=3 Tax=Nostocales TaxID=1161 RepID=A0A0C1RAI6_9CYAN|nr:four helix bundle protein [Tolypothrix bouteillei]KAF3884909.1 four helix bundle protein [Tolypothrix bouteillei VB521301]